MPARTDPDEEAASDSSALSGPDLGHGTGNISIEDIFTTHYTDLKLLMEIY